ncbi:hypothetical protein Tco_1459018 [Tanacetum coccineum]
MPNLDEINDPTTAANMALVLMAKAFKLNYSTPTNNNQRISSNLRNRQIAQPGMNIGQDRHMQMVGGNGENHFRHSEFGNGNVVAARAEGNGNKNNGDIDEIEEVNANYILMANLQQASTSSTQIDKAPIYDSDGSAKEQYNELLEPIIEPHPVQQNTSNVIFAEPSVEHNGATTEQHPTTVEKTRAYFESLYNNLAIEVEKVNTVNRKMKEANVDLTTELARYEGQEKCFEFNQEKIDELENGYRKSVYQEQCLTKKINALLLKSAK